MIRLSPILIFVSVFLLTIHTYSEQQQWDLKSQKSFKTEEGVDIKISPSSSDESYGKISKHLTVVYLSIENSSESTLNLNFNDIKLNNESNRELYALHPDTAASIYKEKNRKKRGFLSGVSIGIGKHVGGGVHVGGSTRVPDMSGGEGDASRLYELAVYPGEIEPNTKYEGLIYFEKVSKLSDGYVLDLGYGSKSEPSKRKIVSFSL